MTLKVATVLPFVSDPSTPHASADTVEPAVSRLARLVDLALYVPGVRHREDLPQILSEAPLTLIPSHRPAKRPRAGHRLGIVPGAVRSSWTRADANDARLKVAAYRPDVVHLEYVHSSEMLDGIETPSVLTLHDCATRVLALAEAEASGLLKIYRRSERLRMSRFERAAVRRATRVLALSSADLKCLNVPSSKGSLLRFGVEIPERKWRHQDRESPVLGFAGAMWRHANITTVEFLVEAVMPSVWSAFPGARLRVIGGSPGPGLRSASASNPRIELTDYVADLDGAILDTDVMLLPSRIGGGVMLKAVRSMALGVPVVSNCLGMQGIDPPSGSVELRESAEDLAEAVVMLLSDPGRRYSVGNAGRAYVERAFSWEATMDTYLAAFESVSQQ